MKSECGSIMKEKLNIVVGSDNVFRDLGFPEGEAQNLLLRADLSIHIRRIISKLGITQVEAAISIIQAFILILCSP